MVVEFDELDESLELAATSRVRRDKRASEVCWALNVLNDVVNECCSDRSVRCRSSSVKSCWCVEVCLCCSSIRFRTPSNPIAIAGTKLRFQKKG